MEKIEEQIMQDADGLIFIEDSFKEFFEKQKGKLPLEDARKKTAIKTKGMMEKIRTEEGARLAKGMLEKALKDIESNSYNGPTDRLVARRFSLFQGIL